MRGSPKRRGPLAVAVLLVSCAKPAETTAPTTPVSTDTQPGPGTTPGLGDSGTWVPSDTAGTITNLVPAHTVRIVEEGIWNMGPSGGPYSNLAGNLQIDEYADGEIDTGADTALDTGAPPCAVSYTVSGTSVANSNCPSCDAVFDLTWTVVEGDPGVCNDPDIPFDGSLWRMGWSSAAGNVLFDYDGTGVWVGWFTATQQGDSLHVLFDTTKAITVDDGT